MAAPICPRCDANPRNVSSTGRIQPYCYPCKLEVNRVYKRRDRHGTLAVAALEQGRALIRRAWTAGSLGDGPLWWYLGMTEAEYERWLGEQDV